MTHTEPFDELEPVTRELRRLSRTVSPNPQHKLHLREELVRRHQELTAEPTQRAARQLWPRFPRLKRLTLVASPALAVVLALGAVLWGLDINGHQKTQSAEAARITRALQQSTPRLVNWQVNLHQVRSDTSVSYQCAVPLGRARHLYVRADGAYLEAGGTWYRVTASMASAQCPAEFQWAFAMLPSRLLHHDYVVLPGATPASERIRYSMIRPGRVHVQMVVQVDRNTGLVQRLDRSVYRGRDLVEHDTADYKYARAGAESA